MKTRHLAGHSVNPVGYGCMSLSHAYGVPPSREEGARLLNLALDLGYTHLDTARLYGLGANETLIGEALRTRRSEFVLASKCGIEFDDGKRRIDCQPETIRAAVEKSLAALQTDFIDLYYLHRRDFNTPIEESVGALADLVKAGKIGGIGLSEMSAETLRRAHTVHPVAAMQTEYSLWSRNPEIAVLEACAELGCAFVAFSPVARGVFANGLRDPQTLPDSDIRRSQPRFSAENWPLNLRLVDQFNSLAASLGITPAQLSLAWVLSRGEHVIAIPGTASGAHLEENIRAREIELSGQTLDTLERLINRQTVAGPRYSEAMQRAIETEEFA